LRRWHRGRRAVHVDVVEDRGAELIGAAGEILAFVEDDNDSLDDIGGQNRRERGRKTCGRRS